VRLTRTPQLSKSRKILPQWIRIAEGVAPVPYTRVDFYRPGTQEQISEADLRAASLGLGSLTANLPERKADGEVRAVAAIAGEIVARRVKHSEGRNGSDVFGQLVEDDGQGITLEAGDGVGRDEDTYRTVDYGYVHLVENTVQVFSPYVIEAGGTRASWLLLDERAREIKAEDVETALAERGVNTGIDRDLIGKLAAQVRAGTHTCGVFTLAAGTPAQEGQDGRIEMLADVRRQAGQEREDGSIDFREVNFAANVEDGQLVAVRFLPQAGCSGVDIYGKTVEPQLCKEADLSPGKNVRVAQGEGRIMFYATASGALKVEGDKISVAEVLYVQGDVSFNTGNLDFAGDVVIKGKVVQGFSVKATGDIIVAETVEAGTSVNAQGGITVGRGVVGRRTRIVAKGGLRAQFVQEATVQVQGDIGLGSYAYHANLQAGGKIVIARGAGPRSGSVMGGQVWALGGIDLHTAGTQTQTRTELSIGLWPEEARQMDRIRRSIQECSTHMKRLLGKFGLARIDIVQIQRMVAASTGPRRKILAVSAHRLGEVVQAYQKLLSGRSLLEERLSVALEKAEIKVREVAHPNVTVRLGQHLRVLNAPLKTPRFRIVEGKLVDH
jgi:uncharacterized protein